MGLIDGLGDMVHKAGEFIGVLDPEPKPVGIVQQPPADVAPAPTDASSAAASQAHQGELTSAQLQLGDAGAGALPGGISREQGLLGLELFKNPLAPIPVKGGRFEYEAALLTLSQDDGFAFTSTDSARCACQSTMAAMLARGPEGMGQDLDSLERYAKDPKRADQKEWKELGAMCGYMRRNLTPPGSAKVTPRDLDMLADKMYGAFGKGSKTGIGQAQMAEMQKACGLAPGGLDDNAVAAKIADPRKRDEAILSAQFGAAKNLLGSLKPGETATVWLAERSSSADHVVLVGRKADGKPFMYDSGIRPPRDAQGNAPAPSQNYFEGDDVVQRLAVNAVVDGDEASIPFFKQGGRGAQ